MEWLKNFKMSNEVYDALKFIVTVVSPALVALIIGLGELYGFNSAIITGTITLLTTFAGALLGISTKNYNAKKTESTAE